MNTDSIITSENRSSYLSLFFVSVCIWTFSCSTKESWLLSDKVVYRVCSASCAFVLFLKALFKFCTLADCWVVEIQAVLASSWKKKLLWVYWTRSNTSVHSHISHWISDLWSFILQSGVFAIKSAHTSLQREISSLHCAIISIHIHLFQIFYNVCFVGVFFIIILIFLKIFLKVQV